MSSLHVITGPMFSGKTTALLRELQRTKYTKEPAYLFVPETDTRQPDGLVRSHDATVADRRPIVVGSARQIPRMIDEDHHQPAVFIDEAQFLSADLVDVIEEALLAKRGCRVVVAGLDLDYRGRGFGAMPQLLAHADKITKLAAVCVHCGGDATRTFAKLPMSDVVRVGAAVHYEPRCHFCWTLRRDATP